MLALYARAGVREFWIVDLTTNNVIVHRDPSGEHYRAVSSVEGSGVLDVHAVPSVTIPVASIVA